MRRLALRSALCLAVCGCETVRERICDPGAMSTHVDDLRTLSEPSGANVRVPAPSIRTLSVPVSFDFRDRNVEGMVMRTDWLSDSVGEARFPAGAVVERTFRKVAASNFHLVTGDEQSVAVLLVRVDRVTAKESAGSVSAALGLRVEIRSTGTGESCYAQSLNGVATEPWTDRNVVPSAFYRALESTVREFSESLARGGAVARLAKWREGLSPGKKSPALTAIEWTQSGETWNGTCEVVCNGYEGFEAKAWANAHIAAACRTKLGGLEPDRVRIVYDAEDFDSKAKRWAFAFRAVARTRIAFSFDKTTRSGVVTGDLELMKMNVESASAALRAFVFDEMNKRVGIVTSEGSGGVAEIRFDNFETDEVCNLVSIRFRLL